MTDAATWTETVPVPARRTSAPAASARATCSATVPYGVWAAGADAGGIATGGYASGLAGALVTGRIAAEAALAG